MYIKLTKGNLKGLCCDFSFFLLFSGYFFYNYLIARGLVPAIVGSYFGVVSLTIFITLTIYNLSLPLKKIEISVIFFIMISIMVFYNANYQYVSSRPVNYVVEMYEWSLKSLLFNIVCFMVAARIDIKNQSRFGYASIVCMFFVVVFNIGDYGIFYIKQEAGDVSDVVAAYQGFARSIVVVLILCSAYYYNRGWKFYILITLGLVTLFFNGARTEFIVFIVSLLSLYLLYSVLYIKSMLNLFFLVFIISVIIFLLFNFIEVNSDSRMFQIFDLANSTSGISRLEQINFGLFQMADNPIFGNYGSYTVLGGIGQYPHNLLSAWVNLGLLGFLMYIILFLYLWASAVKGILKNESSYYFNVFLFFLLFVTYSIIFSKDYNYMLIGLLVGFHVQYKQYINGVS